MVFVMQLTLSVYSHLLHRVDIDIAETAEEEAMMWV